MKINMLYSALVLLLSVAVLFALSGCGNDPVDDAHVISHTEADHPFGAIDNHGEYMVANGYNFATCAACHGEDLMGVEIGENGEKVLSCGECHHTTNHIAAFDNTAEHADYLVDNNWDIGSCLLCHKNVESDAGVGFGKSCGSSGCHSEEYGATACNLCHGNMGASDPSQPWTWAPPTGMMDETGASDVAVGAHQAHLRAPSGYTEAVACGECHIVPGSWGSSAHNDGLPAEVTWGTLASANSHNPEWDRVDATCSNVYCHGGTTPVWTQVDGTYSACGSCHGVPPDDAVHLPGWDATFCVTCHSDVIDANGTIIATELHMNGNVERHDP